MTQLVETHSRDPRLAQRSLILALLGTAGLALAGFVPSLRTPWLLGTASLIAVFGVLSFAIAGTANAVVRSYLPLGAGFAAASGVDERARGGSIRSGLVRAGIAALVWAGLMVILELSEWRARSRGERVSNLDQRPNDR